MKNRIICALLAAGCLLQTAGSSAQELYPFTEPASNNPARSIALKHGLMINRIVHEGRTTQRHMPEITVGLSPKWMVRATGFFANMHDEQFQAEGGRLYAKYRFLSNDAVHEHFRMAAFGAASWSRNHLDHNEINLMGDQSGVQAGLVATGLINKFALSASVYGNEVLDRARSNKAMRELYAFRSVNATLSAGYLLLPREYNGYDQTNLNLYLEVLGGRNLGFRDETYFVDLAPSVQFIFNSTAKLNLGYRFELGSDIYRISRRGGLIAFEYLFLNALHRRAN